MFYHLSSSTYLIAFDSYSSIEVYVAFEYRVWVSYITFDSEVQPHRIRLPVNTESYVAFYRSLGLLTLTEHILKSSTIWKCLKILQSRHEILFLSTESASDYEYLHHGYDLEDQKDSSRSGSLSMKVASEIEEELRVIKRIYVKANRDSISQYSKSLQAQQAVSLIRWMRSHHDWMHQIQSSRDQEWSLA